MTILTALTVEQLRQFVAVADATRVCTSSAGIPAYGLAEGPVGYACSADEERLTYADGPLHDMAAALQPSARAELVAVAEIGRNSLDAEQLDGWRLRASRMDDADAEETLARPSLADDLRTGAELLGLDL